jgi:hypothetical protein
MSNIKELDFSAWVPFMPDDLLAERKMYQMLGRMARPPFGFDPEWTGEQRREDNKLSHLLHVTGQEAVRFEYIMELCWLVMDMKGEVIKCDARDIEFDGPNVPFDCIKTHCERYTRETWEAKRKADVEKLTKGRKIVVTPIPAPNKR